MAQKGFLVFTSYASLLVFWSFVLLTACPVQILELSPARSISVLSRQCLRVSVPFFHSLVARGYCVFLAEMDRGRMAALARGCGAAVCVCTTRLSKGFAYHRGRTTDTRRMDVQAKFFRPATLPAFFRPVRPLKLWQRLCGSSSLLGATAASVLLLVNPVHTLPLKRISPLWASR